VVVDSWFPGTSSFAIGWHVSSGGWNLSECLMLGVSETEEGNGILDLFLHDSL